MWVTTRVLANLALAVVQFAVLFAAGWVLFDVHLPENMGATWVMFVLSALAIGGMGLVVGMLPRTPDAAMPLVMILQMGMALLGEAMMPLAGAPEIVLTIAKFMPTTHMTHGLRQVMMLGKGLGDVVPEILILSGVAVVSFTIAIWQMRKQFVSA